MIETGITIRVYADRAYHFDVGVGTEIISVEYIQPACKGRDELRTSISFGSIDEMEAVAKAMLQAIAISK